jgi:hypothetical protein
MRIAKNLLLAGTAALALVGGTGLALAQSLHTMTVRLPDGGLAQIQYYGNDPPRVAFVPEPPAGEYYRLASPFAMLDRISAQMDREMDALMNDVAMGPSLVNPEGMFDVDMHNLPPGTVQYSFVSTMAGGGHFCTRSMEITRTAPGARPHVVEHTSGDCRRVGNMPFGATPLAPQYHRAPPPIETRAWRGRDRSGPKPLNVAYQPAR